MTMVVSVCFARRVRRAADSRTCVTLPGRLTAVSTCITWIESTTTRRGDSRVTRASMRSTEVSEATLSESRARPSRRARCASLLNRLFAADVKSGPCICAIKAGGNLQEQRAFASAGVAAHQHHRTRHEAAPKHAVEFGKTGAEALLLGGGNIGKQCHLGTCAAVAGRAGSLGLALGGQAELLEGVPCLTGRALPLPLGVFGTALAADVYDAASGHRLRPSLNQAYCGGG